MNAASTQGQIAKHLIDDNIHMTVATADADGTPWVSPVFFVSDDDYDLYWTSWKNARHSQNIRSNPKAGIVIYEAEASRPVQAVYIAATVVEITEPAEVAAAIEVMRGRPQPERWMINSFEDVSGDGPWRIYRAHPRTIEVRSEAEDGGLPIVTREPADFRCSAGRSD
jgi:nitroimidazol reductase NimA-like FMN-containing flavoprotein (pyridoxamine 5'-phosphate oxidase superfamily)